MVMESFRKHMSPNSMITAPKLAVPSSTPQSVSSTWNGGATDRYSWSQSNSEVTVDIPLPSRVESSSDVEVSITGSSLSIKGRLFWMVISGKFHAPVNVLESSWVLEDKCRVVLVLEKRESGWWKSFLQGDAEIDCTKVESKVRMENLAPEARSAVEKILANRHS